MALGAYPRPQFEKSHGKLEMDDAGEKHDCPGLCRGAGVQYTRERLASDQIRGLCKVH